MISEIRKKELHLASDTEFYYLRTYDKNEIDLIVNKKTHNELIEIKKSTIFKPKMLNILQSIRSEKDDCYLIYQGKLDHYDNISIKSYEEYLDLSKN